MIDYEAWRTWIRSTTAALSARLVNPATRAKASRELVELRAPATTAIWMGRHGYDMDAWTPMLDATVTTLSLYRTRMSLGAPDPKRRRRTLGTSLALVDDGDTLVTRIQYSTHIGDELRHAIRRLAMAGVEPDWANVATFILDTTGLHRDRAFARLGADCARTRYTTTMKENHQ